MGRLRSIIVFALVWALVWLLPGIALAAVWVRLNGLGMSNDTLPVVVLKIAGSVAVWGAISGVLFAVLTTTLERGRTIEQLSAIRLGIWGAIGALLPPTALIATNQGFSLTTGDAVTLAAAALIGGACGFATLRIARGAAAPKGQD